MVDVVVNEGRQQVVGNTDGMKVTSEVEVDILHRHNLSVPTASGLPLIPKTGPSEGSRRAITAFTDSGPKASTNPTEVVVLSPAGVGEIAVTRISLPSGLSLRLLVGRH